VVFNDPLPCPDPSIRAVQMALEMRDEVAKLALKWSHSGHDIGFGVGIAHGYATLGSISLPRWRRRPGLHFNDHIVQPGDVVFRHACQLGFEGIVSKRLGSPYRSGPSRDWIKRAKTRRRQQLSAKQRRIGVR
jgi:hypothetical protein